MKPEMTCPRCGAAMNHQADKLREPTTREEAETSPLGGIVIAVQDERGDGDALEILGKVGLAACPPPVEWPTWTAFLRSRCSTTADVSAA